MSTLWSTVVLVISIVDGSTVVEELWLAMGVESWVLWDLGRVGKIRDGVDPGMQVTGLDFPSELMMMLVLPLVGLPNWTKYKTRTTRAAAIRQASRHTRNVFQSDHGFAATHCGCKVILGNLQTQGAPSFEQYGFLGNNSVAFSSIFTVWCCCFLSILRPLVSQMQLKRSVFT